MKQSRKACSLLLTLAFLFALLPVGATEVRAATIYVPGSVEDTGESGTGAYDYGMQDVSEDDYYYDAVDWALVNDITAGTSKTTFSPDSACTRAQVMTFLWRAAGEPEPQSTHSPFTDVQPASYYYKAVLWAVEQGITKGTSATTFSPDAPCTEEQILTFLWRAKGEPGTASVKQSSWSSGATAWAQSSGLVSNTSTLSTTVCTRGNTVYYMYESTVSYSDGTGTFESYSQVSLNGGVYTATTTSSFVSATMTLVNSYAGKVSTANADESYASGRLVVNSAVPLPDLAAYHAAQVVADTNGCSIVQFTSAADAAACANYLDSLSYVNYAEPDVRASACDYGSGNPISWGAEATGSAAYAADLVNRGMDTNVIVAVVDTGVDASHPFLSGRLVSGYDFVGGDATPEDANGHGTHVSGTVVDCTPGTKIKVMPVRVLDGSGNGWTTTIAQGIRYAADHGAQVINLSLGGGHSSYMDSAVNYALSKGVTVVVAAGNDATNAANFCPAHIGGAITISAVDSNYQRAYFSNYGSVVDLAAPGMDITSSIPGGGYDSWQGTSMAAPHASAAAALLLCAQPSLLPATVEKRLKAAAYNLGNSNYYGAGFLDLTPFIGADIPTDTTPTQPANPTPSDPTPVTPDVYTITFDPCGGTVTPTTMSVTPGQSFGSLPTPTRSGYTFAGWYSASGQYVRYFDIPGGSLTLYAHWTESAPVNPSPTPVPTPTPTPTPAPTPAPSPAPTPSPAPGGNACGPNLTWSISGYTLIISGAGAMYDYASGAQTPWASYRGSIRAIQLPGVLDRIGTHAFEGCAITSLTITGIVNYIGESAFANCASLSSVTINGIVNGIGAGAFSGCTSLRGVNVNGIVNNVDSSAFPSGAWR